MSLRQAKLAVGLLMRHSNDHSGADPLQREVVEKGEDAPTPELDDRALLDRRGLRHEELGERLELPLADLDALRVEVAGLQEGEPRLDGRAAADI